VNDDDGVGVIRSFLRLEASMAPLGCTFKKGNFNAETAEHFVVWVSGT
jgi:hypothetical protein